MAAWFPRPGFRLALLLPLASICGGPWGSNEPALAGTSNGFPLKTIPRRFELDLKADKVEAPYAGDSRHLCDGPYTVFATLSLTGWLAKVFDTSDFPPRWHCGQWSSLHGWIHVVSDLAIFGAYFAIPLLIIAWVKKRPVTQFPTIFWLFAMFILACGTGHLVEATIFWQPWYRLSALVKVLTAAVSWATVIAMIRLAPRVLAAPGLTDLARQLQSEISAREALQGRLRHVIDTMPNGVIMVDHRRRIMLANQSTLEMFDYAREDDLFDQPVEMLIPERYRARHAEYMTDYFSNPTGRPMGEGRDLFGRRRDGSEFSVEIGLRHVPGPSFGSNPQDFMVLASIVDITSRKHTENLLRNHTAAIERKNKELDEFTYFASHDLQEPLRKLVSFSTLLKSDLGGDLSERATQDLQFITDAANRMSTLVQDLLRLSRSGRAEFIPVLTPLDECLDAALEELQIPIEKSGVRIHRDPLPSAFIDRTLITQLFQNLVSNAIKYRSPERPIEIVIDARREGDDWVVGVQDNGIGIESEYLQQIFVPFKRLHGRDEYEGSGIGLAICGKVVERHGGRLWAESEFGRGSSFYFTLRATAEQRSWKQQGSKEPSFC